MAGRHDDTIEDDDDDFADDVVMERIRQANRKSLNDMVVFMCFLAVFTAVTLSGKSQDASRFVEKIRNLIQDGPVSMDSVTTIKSYWHFVEGTVLPAIFTENIDTEIANAKTPQLLPLDMYNRLLGGIQMRQVRVAKKEDCQVGSLFANYSTSCYPEYNLGLTEADASFGPKNKFKFSADTGSSSHQGKMASYSPSGFIQLLPPNGTSTLRKLRSLQEDGFVDSATRAIFVDFTIWNSNLGTYAVTRITYEFAPSGAVVGSVRVLVLTQRNFTPGGNSGAIGEWIMTILKEFCIMLFILWYLVEEASEASESRWNYLQDGWNLMDWLNMVLLVYAFVLRLMVWANSPINVGEDELSDRDKYTNLQTIAETVQSASLINSFNAVLLWAKFFKYTAYLPYIKVLIDSVSRSFTLFFSFLCMFAIAFVGFVISFSIGFGDKILEFSTFGGAAVYLCRSFLGDVNLLPVYHVSPLFGAVLILLFYVVVMMVGLNVFFAILTNSLLQPKEGNQSDIEDSVVAQQFQEMCQWILDKTQLVKRLKSHFPPGYRFLMKFGWFKKMAELSSKDLGPFSQGGSMQKGRTTEFLSNEVEYLPSETSMSRLKDSWRDDGRQQGLKPQRQIGEFTTRQVMASVEHMAGRILSRIQGMGIEIRSEARDVSEKMTLMHMAVEELTTRANTIISEQDDLLRES